jgi:hypothetical protein
MGSGKQMVLSASGHGIGLALQRIVSIRRTREAQPKNLARMVRNATRTRSVKIQLKKVVLMTSVPKVQV